MAGAAQHVTQGPGPAERAPQATTSTPTLEVDPAIRQTLDAADPPGIVELLKTYGGDVTAVMAYLQQQRGNAFCDTVLQLQAATRPPEQPSLWERLKASGGKLRLVDVSKAATPVAEPTPEPEAPAAPAAASPLSPANPTDPRVAQLKELTEKVGAGKTVETTKSGSVSKKLGGQDKQLDGSLAEAKVQSTVGDGTVSGTGTAKASVEQGISVGGNADAKAQLVGTTIAIHSKPMQYELFGEQVSAQFHLGVNATTFAEAKGKVGLDVGWTGMGANAELTGLGTGQAELTAAATLAWSKKGPDAYAGQLVSSGAWRSVLSRYLPAWMLNALPDAKVQSWIKGLIELVLSDTSGDQIVLGASTSANARGSLGLPGLSFRGGAIGVRPGAGLSFGGAAATFDLELGKDAGMEMMTMLAFGGATALFQKLAPDFSIARFLERKVDTSLDHAKEGKEEGHGDAKDGAAAKPGGESFASKMAALRDRAKGLDGNHSLAWNKGETADKDRLTKGEGHDFTFTRDKDGSKTRTGDDARAHSSMPDAGAAKKPGKLQELAEKTLGDTQFTVAKHQASYSKTAIDKKTKDFEVAGAKGQLSGRALELQSESTAHATVGAKGLTVGGNANASAYLMGAQVQIETPELPYTILGEKVVGKVAVGVDAGAFAQVSGSVALDVGWSGAGLAANLSGFAGVKAGITASGSLTWQRKPAQQYTDAIVQTGAWKSLFGSWMPQWLLNRTPDKYVRNWITSLVEMLVNGSGDAVVLGAVARAEGSAGIGAAGSFAAKFQGGVLHCHGRGGITFGLGAGAAVDLQLGVTDGMAMLGVMALRGGTDLFQLLQPQMSIASYLKPMFSRMRSHEPDTAAPKQDAKPAGAKPPPKL